MPGFWSEFFQKHSDRPVLPSMSSFSGGGGEIFPPPPPPGEFFFGSHKDLTCLPPPWVEKNWKLSTPLY